MEFAAVLVVTDIVMVVLLMSKLLASSIEPNLDGELATNAH
jgi:hypothetical protein